MIKKFLLLFLFFTANFYGFSLNEITAKIDVDRANRLFKKGNYEDAITLYERALSKITNSTQIYYNLGTTMVSIGETDTAIQLFNMAKNNFNDKTSKSIKNSVYYNSGIVIFPAPLSIVTDKVNISPTPILSSDNFAVIVV